MEFPHFLVRSLEYLKTGVMPPNINHDDEPMAFKARFNLFDCHREEVYGIAHFFGFKYDCQDMAPDEIPAGTSLIFEFLENKKKDIFVRLRLWDPRTGYQPQPVPACHDPNLCTMHEFVHLYNERVQRTGTWQQICGTAVPGT